MSRSAGTLITTNQATYIPPRFMPGYHGHVPTLKFSYAQTYGNATAQYMQDYRSQTLEESKNQYWAGGYFPTIYSHKPDLVIGNRTRSRDRWLTEPRYRLNVRDHDRQENIIHLDKLVSAKRDHYLDKSGTVPKVEYFQIPVPAEQQFRRHVPYIVRGERYSSQITVDNPNHLARRSSIPSNKTEPPPSKKEERAIRDVYFENRGKRGAENDRAVGEKEMA